MYCHLNSLYIKKLKIYLKDLTLEYWLNLCFAFTLLYFSNTMWSTIPAFHQVNVFMHFMMAAVSIIKILCNRCLFDSKKLLLIMIIFLYLLGFVFFRANNIGKYISLVLTSTLTIIYILTRSNKQHSGDSILFAYEQIMLIMTSISLVLWIFGSLLGLIQPSGIIETTWTGGDKLKIVDNYFYLFFTPQTGDFLFLKGIVRNSSIFAEAPMASFNLCIALLIELFVKRAPKKFNISILCCGIITSISITGYIVTVLAFSLYLFFIKRGHKLVRVLLYLCIPLGIVLLGIVIAFLLRQRIGTGSGNTRIDDFIAGYKAWKDNLLFGNGYGNTSSYIRYMSSFRLHNKGFSNSPMLILSYGGLYLFSLYLIGFNKGILNTVRNSRKLIFLILFILMFITTMVPFLPVTVFLIIYFCYTD